jgi:hypothetical protein
MNDNYNVNIGALDAHDKDHLDDCLPRPPQSSLLTFPDTQRTSLCEDYPD